MAKDNSDFFEKKKSWSEVKDELLGCYLLPYFSKILTTKRPVYYIDAFAGKGMFDDGKPGSPIIALDIIESKKRSDTSSVFSYFIEKKYSNELEKNIKRYSNKKVIKGKYEKVINDILKDKEECNVFIYIDPFGIKSLRYAIFEELSKYNFYSIEILMNMNMFGCVRNGCKALNVDFNLELEEMEDEILSDEILEDKIKLIETMNQILGGDTWKKVVMDMKSGEIDGFEAEVRFAHEYSSNLRKLFKYVLNMPIRVKKGARPKYRMIYATNHPDGCKLMNDNMCTRWQALEERQSYGQYSLFQTDVEENVIDGTALYELLDSKLKNQKEYVHLAVFLAELFVDIGIKYKSNEVCNQLKVLEHNGKIEVRRNPAYTDKLHKKSDFWEEKNGKTIEIRYKR